MTIECHRCRTNNPSSSKYCHECATPLSHDGKGREHLTKTMDTPLTDITRGTMVAGRYEVIEELGKGGMGKVYRVFDREIKDEIALKILKPEIAKDEKSIERFRNELKLSRKIAHKNVCRMYDISKENDKYFFTMEYVSGENLKSFLRRSKLLTIATTISIAKQLCEGLAQAHRLGIVHRDLKPSNIMIDREGNVRIMDFGIARSIKTKGFTGSRVMVGTPEYMSPEQAEARDVDNRSDIYSLGVLLYEIVSGQLPFEGETPLSVVLKHREETPRDPKELRAQIPPDLSRLILKCLEKQKDRRYSNVDAILDELEDIEKNLPVSSSIPPPKKSITQKEITVSFNARKILVPLIVVAALVIGGFVILKLLPKRESALILSDKPCLGVLYFENHSGAKSLDHLRYALPELLINGLSPSKYLRVLRLDEIKSVLQSLGLADVDMYSSKEISDLAKKGGIQHVVRGSYFKTGENFVISAALIDAETGETSLSLSLPPDEEKNLQANLDQMAMAIRKFIDTPVEMVMEQAIAEFGATLKTKQKRP